MSKGGIPSKVAEGKVKYLDGFQQQPIECTMRGHKLDHSAFNSTICVAAEAKVNPALPATAVVEFRAK